MTSTTNKEKNQKTEEKPRDTGPYRVVGIDIQENYMVKKFND